MSHTNLLFRWLLRGSRDVPQNRRRVRDRAGNRRRLTGLESLEPRWLMHGEDVLPGVGLPEGEIGDVMPAFELRNVNPNSSTYNTDVSPRDYLQQVSAYYFGYAL